MRFVESVPPLWLIAFLVLELPILRGVSSVHNNKYMTFFTPITSRRYIYLEGKFSYSVQLILQKEDKEPSARTPSDKAVEFIVRAPEYSYYGVMAIIQTLRLRTSSGGGGGGDRLEKDDKYIYPYTCRDYIQFSRDEGNSSVGESGRICGSLERDSDAWRPLELIGPRTFFNSKGSLKMTLHLDPVVRDGDLDLEDFRAEIVFTAYTGDSLGSIVFMGATLFIPSDSYCAECPGTEVGLQTLKFCSTNESPSCIHSTLFCDSKIDCGFEDGFGMDEEGCYFPYVIAGVLLFFIGLVILSIYAFIHWIRIKAKAISTPPP